MSPELSATANRTLPAWSLTYVGGANQIVAFGINDNDRIVGVRVGPVGDTHAVLGDRSGVWTDLPSPAGLSMTFALSINNGGVVAGSANNDDFTVTRIVAWLPDGTVVLPTNAIQPTSGFAEEINDQNVAAGFALVPGDPVLTAFRWTIGGPLDALPRLAAGKITSAVGINNLGAVVGLAVDETGVVVPVRWSASGAIQRLPMPAGVTQANARAINDRGTIAGYTGGLGSRVLRWTEQKGAELMPAPAGTLYSFALAIDAADRIFGTYTLSRGGTFPFVWLGNQVITLPELRPGTSDTMWGANRCGRAVGDQLDASGASQVVIYDRGC